MKDTVKSAVDFLVASYGDISAQAKTFVLNPDDIADALIEVDADSAEAVVLNMLQEANPIPAPVVTNKKATVSADSTDK